MGGGGDRLSSLCIVSLFLFSTVAVLAIINERMMGLKPHSHSMAPSSADNDDDQFFHWLEQCKDIASRFLYRRDPGLELFGVVTVHHLRFGGLHTPSNG